MRKHRLHDVVLGMLLMALVMALAVPVFASVATKTLQADYMDMKLVIDGVEVVPKDVNGNVVEPFAVSGTTYLPVRAVGEALGKEVTWDGNTKTVYLGEVPEGAIKNWVGVRDMREATGSYVFTTGFEELPHIAAAIKETNSKVRPTNGNFAVIPGDDVTANRIWLDAVRYEERQEIWITNLFQQFANAIDNPNGDYLKLVRAMLEDLISDSQDIESVMALVYERNEFFTIDGSVLSEAEIDALCKKSEEILDTIYEFNTICVEWGRPGGDWTLAIYNK